MISVQLFEEMALSMLFTLKTILFFSESKKKGNVFLSALIWRGAIHKNHFGGEVIFIYANFDYYKLKFCFQEKIFCFRVGHRKSDENHALR